MNTNKGLKAILTILSFLGSVAAGGYSIYLSTLGNLWFIVPGVYFLIEALIIFIVPFIKDEYKAMRTLGVFQILGVILMMDYLLIMVFWNDGGTMVYQLSYYVYGAVAGVKFLTFVISAIANKKYTPYLHGFRNNEFITFSYFVLLIELIIFVVPSKLKESILLKTTHGSAATAKDNL